MNNILAREGEYGWVHTLLTGVDHSADFVSAEIHYRDPDGTITSQTTTDNDAANGSYGWSTTLGFLTYGRWEALLELDLGAAGVRKSMTPVVFWIGHPGDDT